MIASTLRALPTHTLCFLTSGERILMLHRRKEPNRGMWNGVGGRIEEGETPYAACLREVSEETGLQLNTARFSGLLSWCTPVTEGALALYTAAAPSEKVHGCDEGYLRWQTRRWVFSSRLVVSNIHVFGPDVLDGAPPCVYHFNYASNGQIQSYDRRPLPASVQVSAYAANI